MTSTLASLQLPASTLELFQLVHPLQLMEIVLQVSVHPSLLLQIVLEDTLVLVLIKITVVPDLLLALLLTPTERETKESAKSQTDLKCSKLGTKTHASTRRMAWETDGLKTLGAMVLLEETLKTNAGCHIL